jgi:hypothetical protein
MAGGPRVPWPYLCVGVIVAPVVKLNLIDVEVPDFRMRDHLQPRNASVRVPVPVPRQTTASRNGSLAALRAWQAAVRMAVCRPSPNPTSIGASKMSQSKLRPVPSMPVTLYANPKDNLTTLIRIQFLRRYYVKS